ncbi:MAG: PQQ-binding-like beta-propeller repeat protein [Rubripirellula sp.]
MQTFYPNYRERFSTVRQAVLLCCALSCGAASGSDWPMYRHDVGRRGISPDAIDNSLSLSWTRELPALTPAFHDNRLHFDAGYEPVVVGQHLLIASSKTDSVKAYDTRTGKEAWAFYTDGPVRFAPAVDGDLVCFGSDDGYLYCVGLADGKLRWKHRAAPSNRRLLGNRRLISVWPVRGGPVVDEGVVYFAAGVIPFEGVFVYAIEIATGEIVWRNDRLGYLYGPQPHNTESIGGLAPQGYLLLNGNELVVPCSNAYPAKLDRSTGDLIDFQLPTAGRYPGGWFAAIDPDKARALRRGLLTFDEAVNRRQHEDKVHAGKGGVPGLSREIRSADETFKFDEKRSDVDGTIHSMIVADDALFVVTREGRIHCFRQEESTVGNEPTVWALDPTELAPNREARNLAERLAARASSEHGFAVVTGLHHGELTKALITNTRFHVVAFDDDLQRVRRLREELDRSGLLGSRVSVIAADLQGLSLPPYIANLLVSERDVDLQPLLQTLRPFGGVAAASDFAAASLNETKPGNFRLADSREDDFAIVRREGPLPGATEYAGDFSPSDDRLVRFPLGVLWFDDTLAHFKRSPQPVFDRGAMISRPKNWRVPRHKATNKLDYPLLPPVLSDIYTGRVLDSSERPGLRSQLQPSSPTNLESSQYRLPGQPFSTKPGRLVAGQRMNPLTGKSEPRTFPKTYGCDGGVDYGSFFTLRSGTAAFYDKSIESGTVFLSGPRSGCTNSIIPTGGVLNVPYFYEGCTCSYPLPIGMSLVAMPQTHEQWSSWGASSLEPNSIQRIGINFGAPGDRMTREGTLWLDYPSASGPSPQLEIESTGAAKYAYRHSLWIRNSDPKPWVSASVVEGLERFQLKDLKSGTYLVRLYFAEPRSDGSSRRLQNIQLQGQVVHQNLDVAEESGGSMRGVTKEFPDIKVDDELTLELSASSGTTLISGIELIRQH